MLDFRPKVRILNYVQDSHTHRGILTILRSASRGHLYICRVWGLGYEQTYTYTYILYVCEHVSLHTKQNPFRVPPTYPTPWATKDSENCLRTLGELTKRIGARLGDSQRLSQHNSLKMNRI